MLVCVYNQFICSSLSLSLSDTHTLSLYDTHSLSLYLQVRDLVDRERNCEDLAMQFLIANNTNLPPIYVKGHVEDLGALSGISTSQVVTN